MIPNELAAHSEQALESAEAAQTYILPVSIVNNVNSL